ncbi:unnamed protein product [Dicrocoelium dendriticum]|nr:unnamed protein product [Dicrocoelium dendriticum]
MDYIITVPGPVLAEHLAALLPEQPSQHTQPARVPNISPTYVKLDILTYNVDVDASSSYPSLPPPIHLCTYWRCERVATDFRLDYAAHWPWDEHQPSTLTRGDLRINLQVDGDVTRMQSLPVGTWIPELHRATWRIPFAQEPDSTIPAASTNGTVRAKFTLNRGPGRPQPVALQFFREECLASGMRLYLEGSSYRMSLCKRRIIGDRYICDPPNHLPRFQLHPPLPPTTNSSATVFHSAQPLSADTTCPCLLHASEHG